MVKPKEKKQSESMPKGFRFLLILVILTWLVLGIKVVVNSLSGENSQTLSVQSNNMAIDKIEIKISGLHSTLIQVDNRLQKVENELDKALKTYLDPSFMPQNKKGDGLSSNEVKEEKQDTEQTSSKEAEETTKETPTTPKEVSFEQMSFEPELLTSGLTEVSDRTAVLEEKIFQVNEALEKATENEQANDIVLASVRLRDAIEKSRAFESELANIKPLVKNDETLMAYVKALDEYAKDGIPSIRSLQNEFDKLVDQINSAKLRNKTNAGFLDNAVVQFSSLVKVRKIEPSAGSNNNEDILARVYQKLFESDLAGAAYEISQLKGNAANIANAWLKKTESVIAARNAGDQLFQSIINPSYANLTQEVK